MKPESQLKLIEAMRTLPWEPEKGLTQGWTSEIIILLSKRLCLAVMVGQSVCGAAAEAMGWLQGHGKRTRAGVNGVFRLGWIPALLSRHSPRVSLQHGHGIGQTGRSPGGCRFPGLSDWFPERQGTVGCEPGEKGRGSKRTAVRRHMEGCRGEISLQFQAGATS